MKVEKVVELENGHKIEFGKATWNENAISIRNKYLTLNGDSGIKSSGEIPIEDVKILLKESVKNGYIPKSELIEIAEACLSALKYDKGEKEKLTKIDKIALMKQAKTDFLYLNDIKEINSDFANLDNEF